MRHGRQGNQTHQSPPGQAGHDAGIAHREGEVGVGHTARSRIIPD